MIIEAFRSIELEQALLGALLKNNGPLAELEISESHFASEAHGQLYSQIKAMYLENGSISWPSLANWSQDKTFREPGDGLTYARDLLDGVVLSNDDTVKHYSEQLIELWRKREIFYAALVLQEDLSKKGSAQAFNDFVALMEGNQCSSKVKTALEVREDIIKSLDAPVECDRTGLRRLDDAMGGGLYRGYTYGFCGAEKAGKTTLAHTISYNLTKSGTPHLYVAMEMGSFQIEQRNLAREKEFNSLAFLDERQKVKDRMTGVGAMDGLYYLDCPGMTVHEILHHVALSINRYGLHGFVVDYWQLIQGQERGESEEKHLRRCAQLIADFARKNKVWCVLLAQMNQDGKLFGGNGLRKACDQLYMIEQIEKTPNRWLRMDASRYTMRGDIGSEDNAAYTIDRDNGPHFREY